MLDDRGDWVRLGQRCLTLPPQAYGPLLLAVFVLFAVKPVPVVAEEFYQDFREGQLDRRLLAIAGQNAGAKGLLRLEKAGLRICQPETRRLDPLGCCARFNLRGDFEITATYELLRLEKPSGGFGNGITLRIVKEQPRANAATLGRFLHPERGECFVTNDERTVKEQRKHDIKYFGAAEKTGQLRLKRMGGTVYFLAAEGAGKTFQELAQMEFGTEDVGFVRLAAVTGTMPCALDVRFVDLRVVANSLPLPVASPKRRSIWIWWCIANIGCVSVIAYLVYRRRRHRIAAQQ